MSQRSPVADQWRRIVQEQQTSGLSVSAFCRRARVPQSSFYAWRRRLQSAVAFVEVKVPTEPAVQAGGMELHLPDRRWIMVRPGFDRRTLRELLAALESPEADA